MRAKSESESDMRRQFENLFYEWTRGLPVGNRTDRRLPQKRCEGQLPGERGPALQSVVPHKNAQPSPGSTQGRQSQDGAPRGGPESPAITPIESLGQRSPAFLRAGLGRWTVGTSTATPQKTHILRHRDELVGTLQSVVSILPEDHVPSSHRILDHQCLARGVER